MCAAVCAESSLEMARKLTAPDAVSTTDGESEDAAFWDQHDTLIKNAIAEHGAKHAQLYTAEGLEGYVLPELRRLVAGIQDGEIDEDALREHLLHTFSGVYTLRLFGPQFGKDLIDEVRHLSESGIPLRRPNGMNRYGLMLEQVGLEASIAHLVEKYLAPIAQMLFPAYITADDVVEHYAFSIRYREGEDTSLAVHTDASAFTFNLCLGADFEGSGVVFHKDSPDNVAGINEIESEPGIAMLHRGMYRHGATPLRSGERFNLVIWLSGQHGYVRVAPYDKAERSSAESRWKVAGHKEL